MQQAHTYPAKFEVKLLHNNNLSSISWQVPFRAEPKLLRDASSIIVDFFSSSSYPIKGAKLGYLDHGKFMAVPPGEEWGDFLRERQQASVQEGCLVLCMNGPANREIFFEFVADHFVRLVATGVGTVEAPDDVPAAQSAGVLSDAQPSLLQELKEQLDSIAKQQRQVPQQIKEELRPVHQALLDDARSWNSSQTIEASRISIEQILVMRRLLRVIFVPADDEQKFAVLTADANASDFEWDNTPEPSQREIYMDQIIQNVGAAYSSRTLSWKQQVTAKLLLRGLGHQVAARSDELICARRFARYEAQAGAVVGVELKKKLSLASCCQGEAEFYTFSLTSNFPFLQIVTDMQRGGFAYWKEGELNGMQLVKEKALQNMGEVYAFLRAGLNALPWNIGQDEGAHIVIPPQLEEPVRQKLVDPVVRSVQAPLITVEKGDVGNDALLELLPWFSVDELSVWDGALEYLDPPSYIA